MIPPTLAANPRLDRWLRFEADGRVRLMFGKVEYGQGAMTALAQIGAEELDVAPDQVVIDEPDTQSAPDEGLTVGSMSIEMSGASVRRACADVRAIALAAAAAKLRCETSELSIARGAVLRGGASTGESYWTLTLDLARAPSETVALKAPRDYRVVGTSAPRRDLPAKLFGAAFLHDYTPEGVLHARVLRQPSPRAKLRTLDEAAIRRAAGAEIEIFRKHDFVAFLAADEAAARRALEAALLRAEWDNVAAIAPELSEAASLRQMESERYDVGAPPAPPSNRKRISARYTKPYISHASMGPSCGVALFENAQLTVWTHAQGVYPLRRTIAAGLGLDPETIDVRHMQGPGNYGHNGADDAAFDAAVLACAYPGKPIRVLWRREDEFAHAPVGTAMDIELTAELDADGRIVDYTAEIWSGRHTARGRALAERALPPVEKPPPAAPAMTMRFSGAQLNAPPSYDIAASRIIEHEITRTPVRTSSLRGLGGPPNEFAQECFVDELAREANADPLAYRLGMLSDTRGRRVLLRAAEMADWPKRGPAGTGKGVGIAYAIHRNRGARVAVAAEVFVDQEVRVTRFWCCADCGLIINPDGARNQIEGGLIMAASWALKEQVRLEGSGVASTSWEDYPILRFDEIPAVEIDLVDAPNEPAFGAGEISSGPAMGAIGNAIAHALDARVRDLPFTRERIAAALLR